MDIKQKKTENKTLKIMVSGIVQGVGFRPLIFRMAHHHQLDGMVRNHGGNVEIIIQGTKDNIESFLTELSKRNQEDYEIIDQKQEFIEGKRYLDFSILQSDRNVELAVLPPDLPTCTQCEKELFTKSNRRYLNPFISCMKCGPRYTIMNRLPYDRETTVMEDFEFCPSCKQEYGSPSDRRFHAQTISCDDCGPVLIYAEKEMDFTWKKKALAKEALAKAIDVLNGGGILAIKGIGGYQYACSPFCDETVLKLRKLKGREEKPFAVMFPDMETVALHCQCSEEEMQAMKSKARPITLLRKKTATMSFLVGKSSDFCGAFLPYSPLHILLTKACGPLIMTSANQSGRPMIIEDDEIKLVKSDLLTGILYHQRRILRGVDDSVVQVVDHGVQMIRRSRGYVPYPVFIAGEKKEQILAMGGDLKATFCYYQQGGAVLSPFFGDLEETPIFEQYEAAIEEQKEFLQMKPELVVCDLHPNYFSTKLGIKCAKELDLKIKFVQHHHAHIASVMAEHGLEGSVIGVAMDGTGYGADGAIWGGEFLWCEKADFQRMAHLDYVTMIGGDQSMKDGEKILSCYLIQGKLQAYSKDERLPIIEAAIQHKIQTIESSSMGRLFDGVAALLGICMEDRFEGECAIMLEKAARKGMEMGEIPVPMDFDFVESKSGLIIQWQPVVKSLCTGKNQYTITSLAYGFHEAVARMVVKSCQLIRDRNQCNQVALSGGVFQNRILIERVTVLLKIENFKVYRNELVPPNDGGISLGQVLIGMQG